MHTKVEPRGGISELTKLGQSGFMVFTEKSMRDLQKVRIRPSNKVTVTQVKSYHPLGTTDGITYTIIPRP